MNWLIVAGNEKDRNVRLPQRLAYELIDASNNTVCDISFYFMFF